MTAGGEFSLLPLRRALASLRAGLECERTDISRDACIKRFEYTYELAWKTLRRFLVEFAGVEERLTVQNIYRRAAREDLLPSPVAAWIDYHQARNRTSHTYGEDVAALVYAVIPGFLADAERLADAMAARLDQGGDENGDGGGPDAAG